MKILVDTNLCEAHGDCVLAVPEVFDLGEDDSVVQVLDETPDESLREKIDLAVRLCPVSAIKIDG